MLGVLRVNSTSIALFDELPKLLFDRIMREFHRSYRPVLLGELSSVVGWSLERTQQAVDALMKDGMIRHASAEEKASRDLGAEANAYVIVVAKCLSIAHARNP